MKKQITIWGTANRETLGICIDCEKHPFPKSKSGLEFDKYLVGLHWGDCNVCGKKKR